MLPPDDPGFGSDTYTNCAPMYNFTYISLIDLACHLNLDFF